LRGTLTRMGPADSTECWVDAFELSRYRGRRRRLYGPAHYISLRSRSHAWGASIDSLIVGPGAYIRLYRSADPQATALWIAPGQTIEDIVEQHVGDDVDSLQILDHPPIPGDPGYDALAAFT
jgi:hypothetical protein